MRTLFRPALTALALLALSLASGAALAGDLGVLRGGHIVFVEPFGPNSVTHLPGALMGSEIERLAGATVEVKSVGGQAGGTALDYLINAPRTDKSVLNFAVLDLTSRLMAEMVDGRAPLLEQVQPVALVSTGISGALIVPNGSPLKTFDDFLAAAHGQKLTLVHLGRTGTFGIELAMLEQSFGLSFADKVVGTRAEILAALARGEADAGFLVTATVVPSAGVAAPPVRPILTFGGERNPGFPTVPTLRERSGKADTAITFAVAIFAPRDMPPDAVAAMLAVMGQAASEPAIQKAAADRNYRLEVRPAAAVEEAIARSRRLIADHEGYLKR
jgi:tripartite-type tricarboxylate transporter receptor subunit TctC